MLIFCYNCMSSPIWYKIFLNILVDHYLFFKPTYLLNNYLEPLISKNCNDSDCAIKEFTFLNTIDTELFNSAYWSIVGTWERFKVQNRNIWWGTFKISLFETTTPIWYMISTPILRPKEWCKFCPGINKHIW